MADQREIVKAAMAGDLALVDNALAEGVDPNTQDERGDVALHWMARS